MLKGKLQIKDLWFGFSDKSGETQNNYDQLSHTLLDQRSIAKNRPFNFRDVFSSASKRVQSPVAQSNLRLSGIFYRHSLFSARSSVARYCE